MAPRTAHARRRRRTTLAQKKIIKSPSLLLTNQPSARIHRWFRRRRVALRRHRPRPRHLHHLRHQPILVRLAVLQLVTDWRAVFPSPGAVRARSARRAECGCRARGGQGERERIAASSRRIDARIARRRGARCARAATPRARFHRRDRPRRTRRRRRRRRRR